MRWSYGDAINRVDPGHTKATQGIFSTSPDIGVSMPTAFFDQIIGTAILVMVIFALTSAVNNPPLGNTAPLFIGLLVVGHRPGLGRQRRLRHQPRPRLRARGWRPGSPATTTPCSRPTARSCTSGCRSIAPLIGGLIGGALFVFGIERFLPAAIAEPAEIGVVEPTPLR